MNKILPKTAFEIKYEIFEDDVAELKTIDVRSFDKEWHQIYGAFTIIVSGHELIPYPSVNLPLSAKRLYSELILTHFELLIDVYNALESNDYIALKYVENPWTWLEIQVDGDCLILSKLKCEITSLKNMVCTDKFLLKDATFDSISNVRIYKNKLIQEIRNKTIDFIMEIQEINSEILSSMYFSKLMNFYNRTK